jgi:large subunit ribosomal protein L13
MKCYQAKAGELSRQWFVIDASNQVVGRLAAQIAPILMGKHRPTYTPHIDTGDCVIVTNVDKVVFTGNKWRQKSYQRYSGYPGGQREEAAWKLFERRPDRILELAIQRMMPKSKMGRHMMDKLKLYVGPNHPHQAQVPVPLEPLSGRPAPAGALFAPEPVEKAPKPRAEKRSDQPATSDEAHEETALATAPQELHDHHDAPVTHDEAPVTHDEAPATESHPSEPEAAGPAGESTESQDRSGFPEDRE